MKLTVYTQTDLFTQLKAEWNALLVRSTANRLFSTWEWQSTWWETYQPGQLLVITCHDDDDKLVGIAPWFIAENANQERVLATIGCKEVTDYLDLIIDRDCSSEVMNAFAQYLQDHQDDFTRIALCNIPQDAISYQEFPAILEAHGFNVQLEEEDVCPIIQLPDTWEGYLNLLDKKQRHELRRKLRRIAGQADEVTWYTVGPEHDITQEMENFLALMEASDPDKAVFLSDENNRRFFKRISAVMQASGWLQLNFLRINGTLAAAYFNFIYNGHVLVYNSGLLPDEFGHLSPGIVLLANTIQQAIENNFAVFDFLQGNEEYKYRMGGQDIHVYNLNATKSA